MQIPTAGLVELSPRGTCRSIQVHESQDKKFNQGHMVRNRSRNILFKKWITSNHGYKLVSRERNVLPKHWAVSAMTLYRSSTQYRYLLKLYMTGFLGHVLLIV